VWTHCVATHSPIPSSMMQSIWLTISMYFSLHTLSPAIHLSIWNTTGAVAGPPFHCQLSSPKFHLQPLNLNNPQSHIASPTSHPNPWSCIGPSHPTKWRGIRNQIICCEGPQWGWEKEECKQHGMSNWMMCKCCDSEFNEDRDWMFTWAEYGDYS